MRSAFDCGLRAALAALVLCLFGVASGHAQEDRVCLDFDIQPEALIDARIGYYPQAWDRQYAVWFEKNKDRHWLLRVIRASVGYATRPDLKVHPFRSMSIDLQLEDGMLVPSSLLFGQLSGNNTPPAAVPPDRCRKYGTVTKETLHHHRIVVQVLDRVSSISRKVPPTQSTGTCVDDRGGRVAQRRADLDFDGFEACDFTNPAEPSSSLNHIAYHRAPDPDPVIMRCDKRFFCSVEFAMDGWDLSVAFSQDRRADWREIKRLATNYLNQRTLSRTPAATE